jgi:hypothetical protein
VAISGEKEVIKEQRSEEEYWFDARIYVCHEATVLTSP